MSASATVPESVIVTGAVRARPDTFDQLLAVCREHVARSRTEPGCVSHAVHRDVDDPLRLVFVEEWASREALAAHFAVQGSKDFIAAITPLVAESPSLAVYAATRIAMP